MFKAWLTTLIRPSAPADKLSQLEQFTISEMRIPLNDARTCKLTISIYDSAVGTDLLAWDGVGSHIRVLSRCLLLYCFGTLVFWGQLVDVESIDLDAGTITFNCIDRSFPLTRHMIREGDAALEQSEPPTNIGVAVSYVGMRQLRDAAQNTSAQDARDVPVLGIENGTTGSEALRARKVGRGDQVWQSMLDMSQLPDGPDFELQPDYLAGNHAAGWYCKLNCRDIQGTDRTGQGLTPGGVTIPDGDVVKLNYGFGLDNLATLSWGIQGSRVVTHAERLPGNPPRSRSAVIRSDLDASYDYGVLADYASTENDKDNDDLLGEVATSVVQKYHRPVHTLSATLKPYDEGAPRPSPRFGHEYDVGDFVLIAARRGHVRLREQAVRIEAVTLSHDQGGNVSQVLDMAQLVGNAADVTSEAS